MEAEEDSIIHPPVGMGGLVVEAVLGIPDLEAPVAEADTPEAAPDM